MKFLKKDFPVIILSLLFFVLSIPGTNALRYALAFFLLIFSGFVCYKNPYVIKQMKSHKQFIVVVTLLTLITLYIFIHNIFISHEFMWSMKAFKGHWIVPLLFFTIGIFMSCVSKHDGFFSKRSLITAVFAGMFLHVLYIDLVALNKLLESGNLITRYKGITGSPVSVNYLTNILMAFSLSEFIYRLKTNNKVIQISNGLLYVVILLLVFSTFVEGMRHGVVALVFSLSVVIFFFLYENYAYSNRKKIFISVFLSFILIVPLLYNLSNDARWKTLFETVPIALDTDNYKNWTDMHGDMPKLPNGSAVNGSNYLRIAWIKKGVEYVIDNPVGIGFGRNSFGHAIQMYEGVDSARGYHAHSSIIDLTVGAGIMWLILWLSIVFYLIYYFINSFIANYSFYAISGFFLTTGFFFRSLVDSNMRDHVFQQFLLILGFVLSLLVLEQIKIKNER